MQVTKGTGACLSIVYHAGSVSSSTTREPGNKAITDSAIILPILNLMSSTVTGKDRPALDPAKMASLYDIIQKKAFKSTSVHEFEKNIIPRINSAVAGICKRLRSS